MSASTFGVYAPAAIGPDLYDEKYLIVEGGLDAACRTTLLSLPMGYHSEILSEYRSTVDGHVAFESNRHAHTTAATVNPVEVVSCE